jgi:LEA14-like dessication related protein
LDFEAHVDVRALDASVSGPEGASRAAFSCAALAHLVDESGGKLESRAAAEGSFLIIREPRLRIRTLKIERDILVTTNLRLELAIENPNEFPIDFGPFTYRFYGEGKSWAEGAFDRSLSVPPRSAIEAGLAFEMNFADRDRKLLDLVAELKTVRYALKGKAKVATGLSFLPEFGIAVDEEGSCQVER